MVKGCGTDLMVFILPGWTLKGSFVTGFVNYWSRPLLHQSLKACMADFPKKKEKKEMDRFI